MMTKLAKSAALNIESDITYVKFKNAEFKKLIYGEE